MSAATAREIRDLRAHADINARIHNPQNRRFMLFLRGLFSLGQLPQLGELLRETIGEFRATAAVGYQHIEEQRGIG